MGDLGLEARIGRLEDERELRELLTLYGIAADMGMREAYVRLFTEDGAIEFDSKVMTPARFEGHEQIRAFIDGATHSSIEGSCQHHAATAPLIFHIDGDEAFAEGCSVNIARSENGERLARNSGVEFPVFNIVMASFNRWRFRRVSGSWRIAERRSAPVGTDYAAQLLNRSIAKLECSLSAGYHI